MFVVPDVVQDEQHAGSLVQEPAQVLPGEDGVAELFGISSDEPGHLGDLGRDGGPASNVTADGDGVDPAAEEEPHSPVGAHRGGERGFPEAAGP